MDRGADQLGGLGELHRAQLGDYILRLRLGRLEAYREVRGLRKDQGDLIGLANVLTEIGWLNYLEGQTHEAVAIYEEALDLHRRVNNRQGETGTLDRLGSALRAQKQWNQARECYQQALDLARQAQNRADQAHTSCNLAELDLARGAPRSALEHLATAFEHFRALGARDLSGEAHGLFLRSRALAALGETAKALIASQDLLTALETIERELANETLQLPYLSVRREYLDHHLQLLRGLNQVAPREGWDSLAFLEAERWRARSLLRHLEDLGSPPGRLRRRRQIDRQLSDLTHRRTLVAGEEAAHLDRQIRSLTDDLGALGPGSLSATSTAATGLDEYQALLADQTLVLVWKLSAGHSQLWVLDHQRLDRYDLPGREIVESAARALRRSTQNSHLIEWQDQAALDAEHLGSLLLGPIGQRLKDQRLVLITDGVLSSVPFASLRIPGRPGRLFEHHELARIPSLGVLRQVRKRRQNRQPAHETLAILADPVFDSRDPRLDPTLSISPDPMTAAIPEPLLRAVSESELAPLVRLHCSGEEAARIAAITPGEEFLALGFSADRRRILEGDLGRFRIVHFATHGLLHPRHPELSGLVLTLLDASGDPLNGYLRAHEISRLQLPADLVVLSACQTALGAEMGGEGLLGLPRSFFQAGASQILVSLWKVDDQATAVLMERFYRHLVEDRQPPIAALRSAQRWMASESSWDAPYFWASFELQGDWDGKIFDDP